MGEDGLNLFSIVRRAFWRSGEIFFVAQVLDSFSIMPGLLAEVTKHFAAFVALTSAGSCLYDLFDYVNRPDLRGLDDPSCNKEDTSLSLGSEL
jgi:hypothetical protein